MARKRGLSVAQRQGRLEVGVQTIAFGAAVVLLLAALMFTPAIAAAQAGTDRFPAGETAYLTGPIATLPSAGLIGDWMVFGTTVHVTAKTVIDQSLASARVGAVARIRGVWNNDGSINAETIQIQVKAWVGPPATTPRVVAGAIASLPAAAWWVGDWVVGGVTVHVTPATTTDQTNGAVAVGAPVMVRGTARPDQTVDATSIQVMKRPGTPGKNITFCGLVTALPTTGLVGDWTVDGLTVHVAASTTIDETKGAVAINASVRVTGTVQADASVSATAIVVLPGQCGAFNQPASMTFSILHLTPTADAPEGAEGVVLTRMMTFADGSTREDLKVAVEHLLANTAYEVMIDAVDAGPIMTNENGDGLLFLSTADIPGAEPLPPTLQDFGTFVEVDINASGGTTVLTGLFANARTVDHQHPGLDYLGIAILENPSSQVVGMASATIKGSEQQLTLSVWGLMPGQTYTLVIDGSTVGPLTASPRGRVQAEYSSTPNGDQLQLPDSLMPVSALMQLELEDSSASVVASGDFQSVTIPAASVIKRVVKRSFQRR